MLRSRERGKWERSKSNRDLTILRVRQLSYFDIRTTKLHHHFRNEHKSSPIHETIKLEFPIATVHSD